MKILSFFLLYCRGSAAYTSEQLRGEHMAGDSRRRRPSHAQKRRLPHGKRRRDNHRRAGQMVRPHLGSTRLHLRPKRQRLVPNRRLQRRLTHLPRNRRRPAGNRGGNDARLILLAASFLRREPRGRVQPPRVDETHRRRSGVRRGGLRGGFECLLSFGVGG